MLTGKKPAGHFSSGKFLFIFSSDQKRPSWPRQQSSWTHRGRELTYPCWHLPAEGPVGAWLRCQIHVAESPWNETGSFGWVSDCFLPFSQIFCFYKCTWILRGSPSYEHKRSLRHNKSLNTKCLSLRKARASSEVVYTHSTVPLIMSVTVQLLQLKFQVN